MRCRIKADPDVMLHLRWMESSPAGCVEILCCIIELVESLSCGGPSSFSSMMMISKPCMDPPSLWGNAHCAARILVSASSADRAVATKKKKVGGEVMRDGNKTSRGKWKRTLTAVFYLLKFLTHSPEACGIIYFSDLVNSARKIS